MRIVHVTTRFFFLCGYGLYNDKFVRTILQQCQDLVDNDNFAVSDACEDGLGSTNMKPTRLLYHSRCKHFMTSRSHVMQISLIAKAAGEDRKTLSVWYPNLVFRLEC